MPSKEEKLRRKAIMEELQRAERARAEAELPLPKPELKALFDFVDARLEAAGCDRTLAHTFAFLDERKLPREPVVRWLNEYGGYCDCEVIANVEDAWGELVGSLDP